VEFVEFGWVRLNEKPKSAEPKGRQWRSSVGASALLIFKWAAQLCARHCVPRVSAAQLGPPRGFIGALCFGRTALLCSGRVLAEHVLAPLALGASEGAPEQQNGPADCLGRASTFIARQWHLKLKLEPAYCCRPLSYGALSHACERLPLGSSASALGPASSPAAQPARRPPRAFPQLCHSPARAPSGQTMRPQPEQWAPKLGSRKTLQLSAGGPKLVPAARPAPSLRRAAEALSAHFRSIGFDSPAGRNQLAALCPPLAALCSPLGRLGRPFGRSAGRAISRLVSIAERPPSAPSLWPGLWRAARLPAQLASRPLATPPCVRQCKTLGRLQARLVGLCTFCSMQSARCGLCAPQTVCDVLCALEARSPLTACCLRALVATPPLPFALWGAGDCGARLQASKREPVLCGASPLVLLSTGASSCSCSCSSSAAARPPARDTCRPPARRRPRPI